MQPQTQPTLAKSKKTSAITPAEARALAQEACIFGLPLVYIAVSLKSVADGTWKPPAVERVH